MINVNTISCGGGSGSGGSVQDQSFANTTQQFLLPDIRTSGDGPSGEGDVGTIDGWATVDVKKYRWYVSAKVCYFEMSCESTTGSSSTSLLSTPLPSDVPVPAQFDHTVNLRWFSPGASFRTATVSSPPNVNGSLGVLYRNDPDILVYGILDSGQVTKAWFWSSFWRIA